MLASFKNLGVKKLSIIISAAFGIFASLLAIIILSHSNKMVVLYNGLNATDKQNVIRVLSQNGADYTISDENILVDAKKAAYLRMLLAAEGLPTNGSLIGYEIFNKEDTFTTSSFTQNVNLLRALEGELARTIMSFEQIQMARVHLVIPKRELFSREKQNTTASVVLKLLPGRTISAKETRAISHLVASAVSGLKPDDVTIVSTTGKAFKLANSDDTEPDFVNHEYKRDMEQHLKRTIEHLVEQSVGVGNVKAEVSIDMDFDQVVINSEIYDPASAVLRSTQVIEEHNQSNAGGGNVSADTNIPNNNKDVMSNTSKTDRTDETRNYEISKEKKHQVKKGGSIKKISIAVLVDGVRTKNPVNGEETYTARDEDTLSKLHTLIISAAGLNFDRGDKLEVINMRFSHQPEVLDITQENFLVQEIRNNFSSIITILSILLTILIISLYVVKPITYKILDSLKIKKQLELSEAAKADYIKQKSINEEASGDINDLSDTTENVDLEMLNRQKLVKRLNTLVKKNPSSAAELLRRWMDGNVDAN